MSSGRFAVAAHALAVLASRPNASSDVIAASVCTHPVIVRRLMGALAGAGLVRAHEGRGGGYTLARAPEAISLREVYEAVEPSGPLAPSACEPSARCRIGSGMRGAFDEVSARAREGLGAALQGVTVATLLDRAVTLGGNHHRSPSSASRSRTKTSMPGGPS